MRGPSLRSQTSVMTRARGAEPRGAYGDLIGVADVSLEVPEGGVVALIGSNGAGKTTTLNAIAGLIPPAAGRIAWQGQSIAGLRAHAVVRRRIALSPEGWRLFVGQTVEQNLRLGATVLADRARAGSIAGSGVRAVPPPGRTAPPAGRHAIGRRAADARAGPCADERPEASAAG